MDDIKIAKFLANKKDQKYPCIAVSVKNGKAFNETNEKLIPLKNIAYQKEHKDGVYLATEATCGGKCSIGKPAQKCLNNGIYNENKCSVYNFEDINNSNINVRDLKEFLSEY